MKAFGKVCQPFFTPPMTPGPKKRKYSDLSAEQTSRLKKIFRSCRDECVQLGMDDEDEDVMKLNRIIDKLTDTKVC
jgi:hypothetical protein